MQLVGILADATAATSFDRASIFVTNGEDVFLVGLHGLMRYYQHDLRALVENDQAMRLPAPLPISEAEMTAKAWCVYRASGDDRVEFCRDLEKGGARRVFGDEAASLIVYLVHSSPEQIACVNAWADRSQELARAALRVSEYSTATDMADRAWLMRYGKSSPLDSALMVFCRLQGGDQSGADGLRAMERRSHGRDFDRLVGEELKRLRELFG